MERKGLSKAAELSDFGITIVAGLQDSAIGKCVLTGVRKEEYHHPTHVTEV